MAGSPAWKVYLGKEYRAACKELADAVVLVSHLGDGSTIRWGHSTGWTVWREGAEEQSAAESYDRAMDAAQRRLAELQKAAYRKAYGRCHPSGHESVTTPDGHGAYCKHCGETLA
jgi:hypothetical protein